MAPVGGQTGRDMAKDPCDSAGGTTEKDWPLSEAISVLRYHLKRGNRNASILGRLLPT